MKRILFYILLSGLLFTACKKDIHNVAEKLNYVTFKNVNVVTPFGYTYTGWIRLKIDIMNTSYSELPAYTGKLTIVELGIDTIIPGTTYSYLAYDDINFDRTKNFGLATLSKDLTVSSGKINFNTGDHLSAPLSGTVTIQQSGAQYDIIYSLNYTAGAVSGKFTGLLNPME